MSRAVSQIDPSRAKRVDSTGQLSGGGIGGNEVSQLMSDGIPHGSHEMLVEGAGHLESEAASRRMVMDSVTDHGWPVLAKGIWEGGTEAKGWGENPAVC